MPFSIDPIPLPGECAPAGRVLPFVALQANSGPYDDASFVAGMRLQMIWDGLRTRNISDLELFVETALLPQLELLALHLGYELSSEPDEVVQGRSKARFERIGRAE